ncbi:hypothetical protein [Microbispora sp. GKU 823]|uniref:hypothetical protein n=1 Tax=Microbispora sp. GKU 823 TaxID=1652100 RepID=UPI0009CF3924|nr:hypothetical protein [Microbispora sp. GKU 823]OPG12258.1 hypothetical protein B1L11_15580 [Microbispora sp. GKU 823]
MLLLQDRVEVGQHRVRVGVVDGRGAQGVADDVRAAVPYGRGAQALDEPAARWQPVRGDDADRVVATIVTVAKGAWKIRAARAATRSNAAPEAVSSAA